MFNSSANVTENSYGNGPGILALKAFLACKLNCAQSDTPTCSETLTKAEVIDALKDFLSRKLHENESEGSLTVDQSSLDEVNSSSRAQALIALKVFLTRDASGGSKKLSEDEQNEGTEIDDSKNPVVEALRELLANRSKQEEEQTASDNEQKSHDTLKANVMKVLRDFLASRSSNIEEEEPNVNISIEKRPVIETLSEFLSAKTSFRQTGAKMYESEEKNKEILCTNVTSSRFVGKKQQESGKLPRKMSARSKQKESVIDHGSEEERLDRESGPTECRQRDSLFSAEVKMKPASQSNLMASEREIQAIPANEDVVANPLEGKSNASKSDEGGCVKAFGTEDPDVGTDALKVKSQGSKDDKMLSKGNIARDSPLCKNGAAILSKYFGKEIFGSTESEVTAPDYQARNCFLSADDIEVSQQEELVIGTTYSTRSDKELFTIRDVQAVSSEDMARRFLVLADDQKVSLEETTRGLSSSGDNLEISSEDTAKVMSISADGHEVSSEDRTRGLTVSVDDQERPPDYLTQQLLSTSADGLDVPSEDTARGLTVSIDDQKMLHYYTAELLLTSADGQEVSLEDTVRGLSFFGNDKEMSDDTAKVLPVSADGLKGPTSDMMGGFPISADDQEISSESAVGRTPISLMAGEMSLCGEIVRRGCKEKGIEPREPTLHRQGKVFNSSTDSTNMPAANHGYAMLMRPKKAETAVHGC